MEGLVASQSPHGHLANVSELTTFSWEAVPTHLETYRQNGTPDAPIYVVGNKCDLESKTEVDIGTVLDFCAREKVSYFDVSCKSGFNVDSLLTVAMNDVYRRNVMHYTSEPITGTSSKPVSFPFSSL